MSNLGGSCAISSQFNAISQMSIPKHNTSSCILQASTMPGPVGGTLGSSAPTSGGGSGGPPEDKPILENVGHCKRCGKETELTDGLCTECRWEIKVGLQHPLQQEKKHHLWPHNDRQSLSTSAQAQDNSGTSPEKE